MNEIPTVKESLKRWQEAVAERERLRSAYESEPSIDGIQAYNESRTAVARARAILGKAREAAAPEKVNDGWDVADQHLDSLP